MLRDLLDNPIAVLLLVVPTALLLARRMLQETRTAAMPADEPSAPLHEEGRPLPPPH